RKDIRKRLVALQVEARQFSEALVHLQQLRHEAPEDADVAYQAGICHEGRLEFTLAVKEFRRVIKLAPVRIEAYPRLADLLRRHLGEPGEADKVIDQMVAANQQAHLAYLLRARYRLLSEKGDPEADLRRGRELAPDDIDILLASGEFDLAGKRFR